MKLILFSIFALFVGLALAKPASLRLKLKSAAPIAPLVEWEEVSAAVYELRELVYWTMFSIYNDANDENAEIGLIVGEKVNEVAENALDLLGIVDREIETETLTVALAREHLGQLMVLFLDLYASLQPELLLLTPETKTKIDDDFSQLYLNVPLITERIYALLEEPPAPTCGLMGIPANETISLEDPLLDNLEPGTEIWDAAFFSVANAAILVNPHNKYLDSDLSAGRLWIRSTSDYPNFILETGETILKRQILFICMDGSNIVYDFGFEVEEGPVVEPTLRPQIKL